MRGFDTSKQVANIADDWLLIKQKLGVPPCGGETLFTAEQTLLFGVLRKAFFVSLHC
jgi:hypothetical protein